MKYTPRFLAVLALVALSVIPAKAVDFTNPSPKGGVAREHKLVPMDNVYNTPTPASSFAEEPDHLCDSGCQRTGEIPVPVHFTCIGECPNKPDVIFMTASYARTAWNAFNIPLEENPALNVTVHLPEDLGNGPNFDAVNAKTAFKNPFEGVNLFPTEEERNAKPAPKIQRIIDMPE